MNSATPRIFCTKTNELILTAIVAIVENFASIAVFLRSVTKTQQENRDKNPKPTIGLEFAVYQPFKR